MSFLERLEILEPQEWIEEKMTEANDYIVNNSDTFADIHASLVATRFPQFRHILLNPFICPSQTEAAATFYSIGYMKGLIAGQEREQRDSKLRQLLEEPDE